MSLLPLEVVLGNKVERASAPLPQTTTESLFEVSGGRVVITSLFGTVTSQMDGSVTVTIKFDPVVGSASDLLSNYGSLGGQAPSAALTFSGKNQGWELFAYGSVVAETPTIFPDGVFQIATPDDYSGELSWTLTYVPLDKGATITAV